MSGMARTPRMTTNAPGQRQQTLERVQASRAGRRLPADDERRRLLLQRQRIRLQDGEQQAANVNERCGR